MAPPAALSQAPQVPGAVLDHIEEPLFGISHIGTDVRNVWYPIAIEHEIPRKSATSRAMGTRLLGEPIALYRDETNTVRCLADRCPHKNAKLSVGRVLDGKMECFYHGWQFDGKTGEVSHIPFLLPDKQTPPQAKTKSYPCVEKHHLIWVWPGDVDKADESLIPCYPEWLDKRLCFWGQTTEMPIDHSLWCENLMDIAHTPFAHDGQFSSRQDGKPLRYETKATKTGLFVDPQWAAEMRKDYPLKQTMEWIAPCTNIVRTTSKSGRMLMLCFYSIPMAPGMTRHIFTMYKDWGYPLTWINNLLAKTPLNHLAQLANQTIPFQDMTAITGIMRNIKEGAGYLSVPIQCDEMAVMYRRWHGKAFHKDVWWKGWAGNLDIEDLTESVGHSCFGADSCGQYERDITHDPNNAQPYIERWAKVHHKPNPFAPTWAGQAALLLSAGALGALGAVAATRLAKTA